MLISLEQGSDSQGIHIHGMVSKDDDKVDSSVIRSWIKEVFPDAIGNKCLSVTIVKDVKQCAKYTLKEGDYKYKGFDAEFIRTMLKTSNKKENLKKKIIDNEESLLSKEITFQQFKQNYIIIKVDHGQDLYNSRIKAYFNRFLIKSEQMSAEEYVEYYDL